jgi:hypothetical protein
MESRKKIIDDDAPSEKKEALKKVSSMCMFYVHL